MEGKEEGCSALKSTCDEKRGSQCCRGQQEAQDTQTRQREVWKVRTIWGSIKKGSVPLGTEYQAWAQGLAGSVVVAQELWLSE